MVMPAVTIGSQNPGQRSCRSVFMRYTETQKAILTDIVASLYAQGFRKLVIVNGHGGNTFKSMIRDLSVDYPDSCLERMVCRTGGDLFEDPGDHADELETSVMMYYHQVNDVNLQEAGKGDYKFIESLNEKAAWIPRDWSKNGRYRDE